MIYFDYSANTPVDPEVLSRFCEVEEKYIGNSNSTHPEGAASAEKMDEITRSIAAMLEINPNEIIYTSGASESNNLAIKGIAGNESSKGRHIISTELEHASVRGPLEFLEKQGYEISFVNIKKNGRIDVDHMDSLLREDTILVAVTAVDSELGTIQPIQEISKLLADYENCRFHVDATQAVGKTKLSFEGVDTLSFAPHKFYGLNGSGFLYKRRGIELQPLIHGGESSTPYRSGTPVVSMGAGMELALRKALENQQDRIEAVYRLKERLKKSLQAYDKVIINSPEDSVPHILNLSVSGVKGTAFQKALSEYGVCVSVKSACSEEGIPSRAVMALGKDRRTALSSWRISISHMTTDDEIKNFLLIFDDIYNNLT